MENKSMNEILTIEDITTRYPSEHVLLAEPSTNEYKQVISGRVLWHSPNQEEVHQKLGELCPGNSALVYTGTIPDDVYFVL